MSVELATTQELIDELMKRSTFVGLILWSEEEQRFLGQIHNHFRLFTSGDEESTIAMLEKAIQSLEKKP